MAPPHHCGRIDAIRRVERQHVAALPVPLCLQAFTKVCCGTLDLGPSVAARGVWIDVYHYMTKVSVSVNPHNSRRSLISYIAVPLSSGKSLSFRSNRKSHIPHDGMSRDGSFESVGILVDERRARSMQVEGNTVPKHGRHKKTGHLDSSLREPPPRLLCRLRPSSLSRRGTIFIAGAMTTPSVSKEENVEKRGRSGCHFATRYQNEVFVAHHQRQRCWRTRGPSLNGVSSARVTVDQFQSHH